MKQLPPKHLTDDSKNWWNRAVAEFGLETTGELAVLSECAASLDRLSECRAILLRDGLVIEGSRGLVAHPASRMEQQHRALVLQACRQLGISAPVEG